MQQKLVDRIMNALDEHALYINTNYYDFTNYITKHYHWAKDKENKPIFINYKWTIDEELKLLNLREALNKEFKKRGWKTIKNKTSNN